MAYLVGCDALVLKDRVPVQIARRESDSGLSYDTVSEGLVAQ